VGFVSDKRNKLVMRFARDHLDHGEEVLAWARARGLKERAMQMPQSGFLYVTPQKFIVHWAGHGEGHAAVHWNRVRSWGVNMDAPGGPLLGVETDDETLYVQMPASSRDSAAACTDFLRCFAERAPKSAQQLPAHHQHGDFRGGRNIEVAPIKRSVAGHTKRVVVTVLGVLLILGGIVLSLPLVPGPGILLIIIGLATLGSEYDWAEDVLQWAKEKFLRAKEEVKKRRSRDVA
jgi:uncharacterized protein (TIGR02611 family)